MVGEDQDVPFQRNTCPTASPAMQKVEAEHDTERSTFPLSMLVADDHVDPFQVSALPDPSTAAQNDGEAQEMPFSCCDPSMSETLFDHEVPFQVTAPPDPSTATQNVVEGQDTESKPWLMLWEGSAGDGADHTKGVDATVVALAGSGISANKPGAVIQNTATAHAQRRDRARFLMLRTPPRRRSRSSPLCQLLRRRCTLLEIMPDLGTPSLLLFVVLTKGRDGVARMSAGSGKENITMTASAIPKGLAHGTRGVASSAVDPVARQRPKGSRTWPQNRSEGAKYPSTLPAQGRSETSVSISPMASRRLPIARVRSASDEPRLENRP